MPQPITQEENLILQSYCTVVLMNALAADNSLLNSDYYKALRIAPPVRKIIGQIRVDNQGALLMFLYAMLVIPKELISSQCQSEYDKIDSELASLTESTATTYDASPVQYVRHIRNAVAHGRVSFAPGQSVTFADKDNKGHTFSTTMPLRNVGLFINQLQEVHRKYFSERQEN